MKYILCLFYILFSVSGLIFMKSGSSNTDLVGVQIPIVNMMINKVSLFGYFCYGISFILYSFVISKFDLGVVIPILGGIINIIILLAAVFIFHESLTKYSLIGASVIILGIVIMNIKV